ncbi:TPA: hypothetical protein L6B02_11110 [Pseudomonas aeruginosa]|nr:hypothetical protein [Pseudomonas aeruginosa]
MRRIVFIVARICSNIVIILLKINGVFIHCYFYDILSICRSKSE